jgi:hypothetical protein
MSGKWVRGQCGQVCFYGYSNSKGREKGNEKHREKRNQQCRGRARWGRLGINALEIGR